MWAQLSLWRVQDGQLDELAVGDTWDTRLEVLLDGAVEVESSIPLGLRLIGDPLTDSGPRYEIVGRVLRNEVIGTSLDAGEVVLAPTAYSTWPVDTVLRFRSELSGSEAWISEPPDPLIRSWRVQQLLIRSTRLVPRGEPNSFRPDWTDVRFRAIERMQMWNDGKNRSGDGRQMADYLLEIDPLSH